MMMPRLDVTGVPRTDGTERFKGNGGNLADQCGAPGLPRTDLRQVEEIGADPVDYPYQSTAIGRAVPEENRYPGPVPREATQGVRQADPPPDLRGLRQGDAPQAGIVPH